MRTGTVKWFSREKKFGFIVDDVTGKDVFVYVKALERANINNLYKDQKISYEIAVDKGKESAANLKVIDQNNNMKGN